MIHSMRVTVAALAALAALPVGALAARVTQLPAHQVQIRAAASAPYHATRFGPHTFYGTIVAIRGAQLVVRLRNGRTQAIDDTRAVAANDYSAPLFLGKLVAVDGTFAQGVFSAQHIYRLSNLQGLQNDR
jgi:hypothetical protein